MKNISLIIALSSIFLLACGGSDGSTSTNISKSNLKDKLANTEWRKECSAYNKLSDEGLNGPWNVIIKLSIDDSLKSTYRTQFFGPADTECNSMIFDTLDISTFEITGKIMSEESIEANGLNETFTYNSDIKDRPPVYTLIYFNSEMLYFGQSSGSNLGKTPETRHSSIILDDYFTQIIN